MKKFTKKKKRKNPLNYMQLKDAERASDLIREKIRENYYTPGVTRISTQYSTKKKPTKKLTNYRMAVLDNKEIALEYFLRKKYSMEDWPLFWGEVLNNFQITL